MQWSQRPHLASTVFYRRLLSTYFKPTSKAFIEHGAYGPLYEEVKYEGMMGWHLWKVWIYCSTEGGHIQRSYNLNGRGEGLNFESIF